MPRGGPRPGSGRKLGSKNLATLSKEQAREVLRKLVMVEMYELVGAQLAHAKGLSYLVTRDRESGKFVRVTEATLKALEDADARDDVIEVWEKEPNVQAFQDLMNRALDKPREQPTEIAHTGGLVIRHELSVRTNSGPALPSASPLPAITTECVSPDAEE
jgi:hypothetical protein